MDIQDEQVTNTIDALNAELLSTVSHELRSPLASIKGYAGTLLRHEQHISRKERHDFLLAINQASDRMERIINRLLELSELEMGKIQLLPTPTNLAHLAQEAIIAKTYAAPSYSLHNDQQILLRIGDNTEEPDLDTFVASVDHQRIREVIDHLLENALLYSPGNETIEVLIRSTTINTANNSQYLLTNAALADKMARQEQTMVEVQVRDAGIGIPQEHLERVFNRFHRVDTSLTRTVNGLGLGLAICKYIITLHHGLIWAESLPGTGSTFHVCLPVDT